MDPLGPRKYANLAPTRLKRRPPLACEQCRRRKIKCDRNIPCSKCTKANIGGCLYVEDTRATLKKAPFQAADTQLSVFDQAPCDPSQQRCRNSMGVSFTDKESSPIIVDTPDPWASEDVPGSNLSQYDEDYSSTLPSSTKEIVSEIALNNLICASPSASFVELSPTKASSVRGIFVGEKFRSESHWSNYIDQSSKVLRIINLSNTNAQAHEGTITLDSCNTLAKGLRIQERVVDTTFEPLQSLVPARELSDRFVQAYLRTFQTVFGVLEVSVFCEQYYSFWRDPSSSSDSFTVVLLLVMCIGSTFCIGGQESSRQVACQWLLAASAWLDEPRSRSQASIATLRTNCLLVLAEMARSIKTSKKSPAPGNLIRMAMKIGLHIDPIKHSLDHMTPSMVESRRRLWAAVLELEIQACMDTGEMISITNEDYDCEPPLNIDDSSLTSGAVGSPKPMNQLTQSSIQVLLMKTMPARLNIICFINKFSSSNSFEKTLALSAELSAAVKYCTSYIDEYSMSSSPPTAFQRRIFDLLVQRFYLGLHHSFAVKGRTDLSYYYSRKVCLDTAVSLLAPSSHTQDNDFARLELCGAGPFLNVYRQCALHICGELIHQLGADSALLADVGSEIVRDEGLKTIRKYIELTAARLEAGDRNIKCYILVSCLLAQMDAMQSGASIEQRIALVLQEKLEICHSILTKQLYGYNDGSIPEKQNTRFRMAGTATEASNLSHWDNMTQFY